MLNNFLVDEGVCVYDDVRKLFVGVTGDLRREGRTLGQMSKFPLRAFLYGALTITCASLSRLRHFSQPTLPVGYTLSPRPGRTLTNYSVRSTYSPISYALYGGQVLYSQLSSD